MANLELQHEVEQLLSSVPGFIAYHGIRSGDSLMTITICHDAEGTAESTRRAADWVRKNLPADAITAPEITDGDAFLSFTAAGATSAQAQLADTL